MMKKKVCDTWVSTFVLFSSLSANKIEKKIVLELENFFFLRKSVNHHSFVAFDNSSKYKKFQTRLSAKFYHKNWQLVLHTKSHDVWYFFFLQKWKQIFFLYLDKTNGSEREMKYLKDLECVFPILMDNMFLTVTSLEDEKFYVFQ